MSYNAKAIVCHDTLANGGWKMEDVSVRKPGDGELLIEMVASVSQETLPTRSQREHIP
jgi:hypothetical protein